jgi:hypothetical protein
MLKIDSLGVYFFIIENFVVLKTICYQKMHKLKESKYIKNKKSKT